MKAVILALAALYGKRDLIDQEIAQLEADLRGEVNGKEKPGRVGLEPVPLVRVVPDGVGAPFLAEAPPAEGPEFFGTWEQKIIGYLDHFGEGSIREVAAYFGVHKSLMDQVFFKLRKKGGVLTRRKNRKLRGKGAHFHYYKLRKGVVPPEPKAVACAWTERPKVGPKHSKMQEATEHAMNLLLENKGGPVYYGDVAEYVSEKTGRFYSKPYMGVLMRNTGRVTSDGRGNYRIVHLNMATLGSTDMADQILATK